MHYRYLALSLSLSVSAILMSGCTMTKNVVIDSSPPGATISQISPVSRTLGRAPYQVAIQYSDSSVPAKFIARLDGYEDSQVLVPYQPKTETQYTAALTRKEVVVVDLVSFKPMQTSQGVRLTKVVQSTLAYLEVIERSPNVKSVTRVTSNEDQNVHVGRPVLSPAEDLLVYQVHGSDQSGAATGTYCNIWKQGIGSFGKTRVTYGNKLDLYPAFSPDGKYIYFSSNRTSENSTIWRISSLGSGGLTKITNTQAEDYGVSYIPNEDRLAYTSFPPGANTAQIWTVNLDGSLQTQLREGDFPVASPDGTKILFVREDTNTVLKRGTTTFHPKQIWVMSIDGGNETQLTQNTTFNCIDPRWSPDGQWIVYSSDEATDSKGRNNYDIWLMKADGSAITQLTTNGSMDDSPCWDREGKAIYFRSNRGGVWNIWRFEPVL